MRSPRALWICDSCRTDLRRSRVNRLSASKRFLSATQPLTRGKLPEYPVRTRFAPSPTGNLHLGSIRTALFNYLLARKTKGQFLLRLEDTDQKRTVPGAEEKLYEDLKWAGLHWDEGPVVGGSYGPYRQSERLHYYQSHVKSLVQSNHAYRCFCTPERLDELNRRRHELGLDLGYDRKCAAIDPSEAEQRAESGEAHVIRFRAPMAWPRYTDLVYGSTGKGDKKLFSDAPVWDDAILIKSDGFPTYHWANVCDDHDMQITHVVRGSEWMSSTPLHVAIYQAKEWQPPLFAHVPLLVDQNKQKLSKRNFDTDVSSYKTRGIFPEAFNNFAALLGWSHQESSDVMNLAELEQKFDLKITKGNTVVAFTKLRFLQAEHARRRIQAGGEPFEQMIRDVAVALLEKFGAAKVMNLVGRRNLRDVVAKMLQAEPRSYQSAGEFADKCSIYLDAERVSKFDVEDSQFARESSVAALTLTLIPENQWDYDVLSGHINQLIEHGQGQGIDQSMRKRWKTQLYHFLRWALLRGAQGPSITHTMDILGRRTCVDRIERAVRVARLDLQTQSNASTKATVVTTPYKSTPWSIAAA